MLAAMKRRTVSLSDDAADALERLARRHAATVSGVVEAAAQAIAVDGPTARDVAERIVPARTSRRSVGTRAAAEGT